MANDNTWYRQFFSGAALELWRRAISHETTEDEANFLVDVLDLSAGSSVLDIPCGNGRLCLPLSLAGFRVTGVDVCNEFLQEARAAAAKSSATIEYVSGDMKEFALDSAKQYDGAYCMGNSFGYLDFEGTCQFLARLSSALRPDAKFVVDTSMTAESFLVNGGEREWIKAGDIYMLVENKYDCRQSRVETEYVFLRNGIEERRKAIHWIYTTGQLCKMFESAGFSIEEMYNSLEMEPFSLGDEKLILVARRVKS